METTVIQFEQYRLDREEEEGRVTLRQKRSDLSVQDMARVKMLEVSHPHLLPAKVAWDEDYVSYQFDLPALSLSWEAVKSRPISERLRIFLNCVAMRDLLTQDLTFFLAPENISLDANGNPRLFYRGLRDAQPPFAMDEELLLRQLKSLIISQFSDQTYNDLYNGGLEVIKGTAFVSKVQGAEDLEALHQLILADYEEAVQKETATLQSVPRVRFTLYRRLTVIFGVLALLFVLPLAYFAFVREPFHTKMLASDKAFLKVDYSAVIKELEDVNVDALPTTQKYTLAYSYIQLLDLNPEARKRILNNVSLNSDERYLDYWILDGRGDYDKSLDLGKQLEDYQLIIYALGKRRVQVRNDETMDGSEREAELDKIANEIKKYNDLLEEALAGDTDDSSSSAGSAASEGSSEASSTEASSGQ